MLNITSCVHNCSGRCLLQAYVRDGAIVRLSSPDGPAGPPGLRACARGRAYRQRIYSPDRLQFPLKRTGERGEGHFVRVGWDEALDTVARELARIKAEYSNAAIFDCGGSGNQGQLHNTSSGPLARFLNMFGGRTARRGQASWGGVTSASEYSYGTNDAGNDSEDLVNSRLILMWSWNPAETITGVAARFNLLQAKERGIRIVALDPRYTDSIATYASEWIPIRPGSDGAMLAAMAYTIIAEGIYDEHFVDTYTLGFDAFRDYILGVEDGLPKTPDWASPICGVAGERIAGLAREYATTKPAALVPGGGHQRTAFGEQPSRLCIALATITGNVGKPGGNAAGHYVPKSYARRPVGKLPIGFDPIPNTIPINRWAEAILKGTAGGYDSDIKAAYLAGRNLLNQFANIHKGEQALRRLEFVVVHEQFMTPTARFADILLPIVTWFEHEDIALSRHYAIYMPRIIEPMYECKCDLEIFTELADRLGIEGYNDKTEEEWLRSFCAGSDIEDFERFQREGVFYFEKREPFVAFREQIENPARYPFPTPSGKIELYSPRLAELGRPEKAPAIPKYISAWESPSDPLAARFSLQLITPHCKTNTHSSLSNIPWLRELELHSLWINSMDAASRHIADGETVRVFNQRGEVRLPAKVTERIMPGVVSIYQGVWYAPDGTRVDLSGSANVLTRDQDTPIGEGATTHTCLVQVEKL